MAQSLLSHNLLAFNHIQQAAREYSGAEFKFYQSGFFKYVKEDSAYFIEDMYVVPEHRGTPVSQDMFAAFHEHMVKEGVFMYYGRIYKHAKQYKKRMQKFQDWGMKIVGDTELYTIVSRMIIKEGQTNE